MKYSEETGCLVVKEFKPCVYQDDRNHAEKEGIMMPCTAEIGMKEIMNHALRATPRAVKARKAVKYTLRHDAAHFRINGEVEHRQKHERRQTRDGQYAAFGNGHHDGERRVSGR